MKASLFKELWNGVWHFETPTNETIRWMVDCGLGEVICCGIVILPTILLFIAVFLYQEWKEKKSSEKFERRYAIAGRTQDFTVYDMSDEELDEYEATIDF